MRKIILVGLLASSLYGNVLDREQITKTQIAYNTGAKIKASDGTTFENTLASIMGTESSWGKMTLGDKFFKNGKLKPKRLMSLGNYQIKVSTAKETINKYNHLNDKYSSLLKNENLNKLIKELQWNSKFGAEIAGHYLLSMYEQSIKKDHWNPYMKAVGRYNGGWMNMTYAKRVILNMQILKKLKKERKIIDITSTFYTTNGCF